MTSTNSLRYVSFFFFWIELHFHLLPFSLHFFVVFWQARFLLLVLVRANLAIKIKSVPCTRLAISITLLLSIDKDSLFVFQFPPSEKKVKLQAKENVSSIGDRKITGFSFIIKRKWRLMEWVYTKRIETWKWKRFSLPLFTSQSSCCLYYCFHRKTLLNFSFLIAQISCAMWEAL